MKPISDLPSIKPNIPDGQKALRFRVGDRLKKSRVVQGLTLRELAARLNTTGTTIQRFEAGNATMNLEWLDAIASALGLPLSVLFDDIAADEYFKNADMLAKIAAFDQHVAGLVKHLSFFSECASKVLEKQSNA